MIKNKKVKTFEYRIGWGGPELVDKEVNKYLKSLYDSGIHNFDIKIIGTGKGVVFVIIFEED